MTTMCNRGLITEADIRACLIERATAYAAKHGVSLSAIGIAAVGDSKFISRVRDGLGFNIKTYQRVIDWMAAEVSEAAE